MISEEQAFQQMSPVDQMRAPSPRVKSEEAAANRQRNARDLLSIIPGPGNVIAAEDAVEQGGEMAGALREGRYGRAALHGGLGALSAFGAVTGLPTGRMAGNAARGAKDSVFSGAGPISAALPMDEASRMARAKDMGFRTGMPLYHGTNADIKAFDPSQAARTSGSSPAGHGVFAALDPQTAAEFADLAAGRGSGQNILKILHRADRPAVIHLTGDEKNLEISGTLKDAWADGYDAVMLKNYQTPGGGTGRTILVVKDPSQLRSPNAKFDPGKRDSSDLLAGVAGASLLAPATAAILNGRDDR